MMNDPMPSDLEGLKYRELQSLCKRYGLKASGKMTELLERLRDFQSQSLDGASVGHTLAGDTQSVVDEDRLESTSVTATRKTGTPQTVSPQRRRVSAAGTVSAGSRPIVSMETAVSTPLPPHPRHTRESLEGESDGKGRKDGGSSREGRGRSQRSKGGRRRQTRGGTSGWWMYMLGALVALGVSLAVVKVIPYCQEEGRCGKYVMDHVKSYGEKSVDVLVHSVRGLSGGVHILSQGMHGVFSRGIRGKTLEKVWIECAAYGRRGMETVMYGYRVSKIHVHVLVERCMMWIRRVVEELETRVQEQTAAAPHTRSTIKNFEVVELNPAVLASVLRHNDGAAWESTRTSLEDVWALRKMSEGKANTVLFACGSIESCHRIGDELVGVVDPNTVLRMDLAGHSDATQKGEVQARLATFLGKHPQGIVVLPQVDRIPLHLLAVLNNVMGEGGSLYQDGTAVTTSEATFFMTIEVAPALMAEESSVDLTLAVKTYLQQALLKGSDQEAARAIVTAFRRRIDVVAPAQ